MSELGGAQPPRRRPESDINQIPVEQPKTAGAQGKSQDELMKELNDAINKMIQLLMGPLKKDEKVYMDLFGKQDAITHTNLSKKALTALMKQVEAQFKLMDKDRVENQQELFDKMMNDARELAKEFERNENWVKTTFGSIQLTGEAVQKSLNLEQLTKSEFYKDNPTDALRGTLSFNVGSALKDLQQHIPVMGKQDSSEFAKSYAKIGDALQGLFESIDQLKS